MDEYHHCCDVEDILELDEEIQDRYDLFIEECGVAPNYADVYIEYKDGQGQRDIIALNPKAGEKLDDEVVFTCLNFEEFKKLAEKDCKEYFRVMEIYDYFHGNRDHELKTEMKEKTLSEKSGASAPITEWDTDTIDNGTTLINAEEKEVPYYEDLSRISNVKVFRNPLLHDRDEYRIKCMIDGVQQMGRVIFPMQIVALANGTNRTKIAAQAFAREMTLNNPCEQSRKNGRGL